MIQSFEQYNEAASATRFDGVGDYLTLEEFKTILRRNHPRAFDKEGNVVVGKTAMGIYISEFEDYIKGPNEPKRKWDFGRHHYQTIVDYIPKLIYSGWFIQYKEGRALMIKHSPLLDRSDSKRTKDFVLELNDKFKDNVEDYKKFKKTLDKLGLLHFIDPSGAQKELMDKADDTDKLSLF